MSVCIPCGAGSQTQWKPNPGPLKDSQVLCTADTSPALRTDQKGLWAECSEVVKHLAKHCQHKLQHYR